MNFSEILPRLTGAPGVSGAESAAAETAMELLSPFCDSVYRTNRGTVVGLQRGNGPWCLFDAHIDQIGLIVTDYDESGFLHFAACGGTDPRVLAGAEVTVLGEEPLFGVISSVPPHLKKAGDEGNVPEIKSMAIDTGLSDGDCRRLVHRGDRVVLRSVFTKLLGNEVMSGALDDRSGVACLIRTAELLRAAGSDRASAFTFSVQEEVGGRGAATAAWNKDIAAAVAVDVSFGRTPGCAPEETAELGKGPMIGFAPSLARSLSEELMSCAKQEGIPFQREIMNGRTGTHADELAVLNGGIRTGLVSIPLKYMHTPVEVVDTDDLEAAARLLTAWRLSGLPQSNMGKGSGCHVE